MNIIEEIRKGKTGILIAGNHEKIIQSILDFDFLSGKSEPSIVGIVSGNRKVQKFFFGPREILLPCFKSFESVPDVYTERVSWLLNLQSGRRVFDSTVVFFKIFPHALGAHLFAENVPERHATELIRLFDKEKLIAGPSGVGMIVPGSLKLGAIGGTDPAQLTASHLGTTGSVAIVSTSGGMTNELIRAVASAGKRLSFSISIGGDRFPVTSLTDVLLLAESDPSTSAIVYFGELGGSDEYEIVELVKSKRLTKPVLAYIAGIIDEAFDEHMQFGHAKALVARQDESARAKRDALREVGVDAPETFPQFLERIHALSQADFHDRVFDIGALMERHKSILSTRNIIDLEEVPIYVENGKLTDRPRNAFAAAALEALLDREASETTTAFVEAIFELLIDHGGNVSGAVNTMITARAGRDMVSSLASGLLTIGPRFGGAINEAARAWIRGVSSGDSAATFVEARAKEGVLLSGIGHRKYRVGIPDPRVEALAQFTTLLKKHPHYDFARAVEQVTTSKNGSLILNVDGIVASVLLDILVEVDGFSPAELQELLDIEFFNALFVIPRTVGFIAHFMEQKRNDEGLFRLPDELLFVRDSGKEKKHRK
ncbi:MAG TPA: citrate/2-methylcitrate synthase [Candidatus Paceibacterota bacterium]|nr:citrate/2-methylcitrate synthase [Candidatus Paceibacterota bacterium]